MGRWADLMFEKIVEREGQNHYQIQKDVQDRQQVLATAPDLWHQLADGVLGEANDLNDMRADLVKVTDQSHASNPGISISVGERTLRLSFRGDVPKITYSITQSQGPNHPALRIAEKDFTFRVLPDGVWLVSGNDKMYVEGAVQVVLGFLV